MSIKFIAITCIEKGFKSEKKNLLGLISVFKMVMKCNKQVLFTVKKKTFDIDL